jgi:DedD protein
MAAAQSPELQHIKSRNRRRLIGAIAIVAALVVFLPMLLDKGPKPLKQDIAINIPAKEGEGYKPLNPPAKAAADKGTDKKSTDAKSTESQVVPAAPSIDVRRGAPQTSANDVTQASGPGKNAVLKPMSKVLVPTDGTVVPAVVATPTPAPKPALTPTLAPAKPAAQEKPPAGKFAVQIGVFSDPANAKEIQAKLAVKGFKSTAETLADGKIRVRILGYVTRDEADKALPGIHEVAKSAFAFSL